MRIQRTALLKEFGYRLDSDHYESQIADLRLKLQSAEQENLRLRKKISESDQEKIAAFTKAEQITIDVATKDRAIVDLQNNVARLRNEIWRSENSKAPVQIFAFSLFILILLLIFT